MKTLILGLFLTSTGLFAQDLSSQDALGSVLGFRTYQGEGCSFTLSRNSQGVLVEAYKEGLGPLSRMIPFNSVYRWNPGQRYFLWSLDVNETHSSFMTRAISGSQQYMALEAITYTDRDSYKFTISCDVWL